jgi:hypothetical protein
MVLHYERHYIYEVYYCIHIHIHNNFLFQVLQKNPGKEGSVAIELPPRGGIIQVLTQVVQEYLSHETQLGATDKVQYL